MFESRCLVYVWILFVCLFFIGVDGKGGRGGGSSGRGGGSRSRSGGGGGIGQGGGSNVPHSKRTLAIVLGVSALSLGLFIAPHICICIYNCRRKNEKKRLEMMKTRQTDRTLIKLPRNGNMVQKIQSGPGGGEIWSVTSPRGYEVNAGSRGIGPDRKYRIMTAPALADHGHKVPLGSL